MTITTYQTRYGWGAACTFGETHAPVARVRPVYANERSARSALMRMLTAGI